MIIWEAEIVGKDLSAKKIKNILANFSYSVKIKNENTLLIITKYTKWFIRVESKKESSINFAAVKTKWNNKIIKYLAVLFGFLTFILITLTKKTIFGLFLLPPILLSIYEIVKGKKIFNKMIDQIKREVLQKTNNEKRLKKINKQTKKENSVSQNNNKKNKVNYCWNCGLEIRENANYCKKCGEKIKNKEG